MGESKICLIISALSRHMLTTLRNFKSFGLKFMRMSHLKKDIKCKVIKLFNILESKKGFLQYIKLFSIFNIQTSYLQNISRVLASSWYRPPNATIHTPDHSLTTINRPAEPTKVVIIAAGVRVRRIELSQFLQNLTMFFK